MFLHRFLDPLPIIFRHGRFGISYSLNSARHHLWDRRKTVIVKA